MRAAPRSRFGQRFAQRNRDASDEIGCTEPSKAGALQKSNASDFVGAALTIARSGAGSGVPGSRNLLVIG
jgi:hypothetical protein